MADSLPPKTSVDGAATTAPARPPPKGNPVFRMMGLPNIRPKLPSRNWTIFLSVVGSFAALVTYDRREKKKIQQRWCTVVANLADEPLDVRAMPRKVTVFLAAPPGDGLRPARDHFNEYVKPILVAGALDWDMVEGRREGEVRAGLAEQIRKRRRQTGEVDPKPEAIEPAEVEDVVGDIRQQTGVREWSGIKGDIVIGRHTWKEYVRGLHEGWLGPLQQPPLPASELQETPSVMSTDSGSADSSTTESNDTDAEPPATKPDKPGVIPPYISPESYASISLPPSMPESLDPTSIIPFPHVLGFLKTPVRIYRFLTQRYLADEIGRETAAAVLGKSYAPFGSSAELDPTQRNLQSDSPFENIANALVTEEMDWPKKIRQRKFEHHDDDGTNSQHIQQAPTQTWTEDVILDPRVAQRMRRFQVAAEDDLTESKVEVTREESFSGREERIASTA
ncbi:MAG: hypothetical protein M1823_002924 [Watsoniomyces obsoletus]|nr:MAG: hypothetical protein M1823_002924 [Watsoniomyces obsoletus]